MAFGGYLGFPDSENTGSEENRISDFTYNYVHFYFTMILSVKYFLIAVMLKCSFGIPWCVKSQKSADLIYTAAEGWNLALSNNILNMNFFVTEPGIRFKFKFLCGERCINSINLQLNNTLVSHPPLLFIFINLTYFGLAFSFNMRILFLFQQQLFRMRKGPVAN